jgi:hypothetical protein
MANKSAHRGIWANGTDQTADVYAVFEAGLSGGFGSPFLSADQLLQLSELCLARNRFVYSVEAYEITTDAETARVDLSRYGANNASSARSPPGEAQAVHAELTAIVANARREPATILFQVWLD